MAKKLIFLAASFICFSAFSATHTVLVWSGYMKFVNPGWATDTISMIPGDTIQWLPLDAPTMPHTITSTTIPSGAATFDQVWQMPSDTFFRYIPQIPGIYQYVCTPHINMGMTGIFIVESNPSKTRESVRNTEALQLFPNPATRNIGLASDKSLAGVGYWVTDIQGKIVLSGSIGTYFTLIPIENLPAGTYFLLADGGKYREKILKR
ncbi:MAG: T9SS type A sorting domain-containing protein [Bacteroidota bacterium]|jgi:hypothetical protein